MLVTMFHVLCVRYACLIFWTKFVSLYFYDLVLCAPTMLCAMLRAFERIATDVMRTIGLVLALTTLRFVFLGLLLTKKYLQCPFPFSIISIVCLTLLYYQPFAPWRFLVSVLLFTTMYLPSRRPCYVTRVPLPTAPKVRSDVHDSISTGLDISASDNTFVSANFVRVLDDPDPHFNPPYSYRVTT